jgi:hypothetical protein
MRLILCSLGMLLLLTLAIITLAQRPNIDAFVGSETPLTTSRFFLFNFG